MKITVLAFAQLREALGFSRKIVILPEEEVTAGAAADLVLTQAAKGVLGSGLRYAVNDDFVSPHTVLKDQDTLALIGPVSGG